MEQGEPLSITEESNKTLHADFMRGVHDNAGFYSAKIRITGQLEDVQTMEPADIEEGMNRLVYKEAKSTTL